MKRREFLRKTVTLTGSMVPGVLAAKSVPCPPVSASVSGGTDVNTPCIAPGDAEADWIARSTDTGVVWAHDFRSDAEVNNFVKAPNGLEVGVHDQRMMAHRSTADGVTGGGCLEVVNIGSSLAQSVSSSDGQIVLEDGRDFPPVNTPEAAYEVTIQSSSPRKKEVVLVTGKDGNTLHVERGRKFPEPLKYDNKGAATAWSTGAAVGADSDGGWARPLSALVARDNGLSKDDPAAGGRVTLRRFNRSSGQSLKSLIYNFRAGYYGHSDYHAEYKSWNGETGIWDGDEFYLQFRVKIDPRKLMDKNEGRGKLWFLHMMGKGGAQQLVMQSPDNDRRRVNIFTNYGSNPNSQMTGAIGVTADGKPRYESFMPGSRWESTCVVGDPSECWDWPVGEWVTMLLHVKPGHDNDFQYPLASEISKKTNLITVDDSSFTPTNDGRYIEFETNTVPVKDTFRFAAALDNQAEGYFDGWQMRFLGDGVMPGTFKFKVVSYRVLNGRARWRIESMRSLTALPNGRPAAGDSLKVIWSQATDAKYRDTTVEVWAKRPGEPDYVRLYSKNDLAWIFGDLGQGMYDLHPPAFNCFQPTGYQNVQDGQMPPRQTYWYRFDQIILSHRFIPAPRS